MKPSELFYQQRTYPERTFNVDGYFSALGQVEANLSSRNAPERGFGANWDAEGPNNVGGRVNCIAIHPTNSAIILIGTSSGGMFRTSNGGNTWIPVFDNQNTLAIGDIVFSASNPDIVFVGTGDPNISGYPFVGNGIYKSIDAGLTWTYSGLTETRIVSRIVVHPTNPNIIYAATMGSPFERNEDRGLYKSINGGLSWTKIFFASNQAGVIDVILSRQNPNLLYLAAWDRIRTNKESIISGTSSKVYRSLDGGNNWSVVNGLPSSDNGRIGLAFSPISPTTIVAIIATTSGDLKGIYRTTNSGTNWTNLASASIFQNLYVGMGWYFGKIAMTANGEIYALGVDLWRYRNSAWENITEAVEKVHVDMHDVAFYNNFLVLATDGGVFRTEINSGVWAKIENLNITQCYRVSISPHAKGKYWIGSQDNGTIVGNKSQADNWNTVQLGDGFRTQFYRSQKKSFIVELQEGNLLITRDSGRSFTGATLGMMISERKSWDMPYFISDFPSENLYAGTYRAYKSSSANSVVWQSFSSDLTKGNFYGDKFHVVTAMAESKYDEGIIYAGTSDGNVWIFEQKTWFKISDNLPNRYVTSIRTSPSSRNSVFVTHSGYKDNDNTALVHVSTDKGFTWQPLKGDLPDIALNDIAILPNQSDSILFVATDAGVFGTTNKGRNWQRLGKNMPMVPVYELAIDSVNRLLIAATHGRSVFSYPLDTFLIKATSKVSISGKIILPAGSALQRVKVSIQYDNENDIVDADNNGFYTLSNRIPLGSKVTITPSRIDNNASNGVSTSDVVAIQKHVLSVLPLNDPYKIIAADANLSNSVSTSDIVLLRKLILTLLDTLPRSWRFVPKDYVFPTPLIPYNAPSSIVIQKLDAIRNDLDFIGIKSGDVNNSVSPN
ncbi:MAG: hypothetical protein ACOYOA_01040 [Saprospiraceae bacterium]